MKYKFKKLKESPSTAEFWYDIAYGGYLRASQFSSDPGTIKAINESIALLKRLEDMCETQ